MQKQQTTIYFVRHAEAVKGFDPNRHRPLTDKGKKDCHLVTEFLKDKQISAVYSSPYKRAVDTISDFAKSINTKIQLVEDFREREKGTRSQSFAYMEYAERQWKDFSYKLPDGESLAETQARNISALQKVLQQHCGENIVIGTHGQALGTIINHFDKSFDFERKKTILNPFVVKMMFDGDEFVGYEMIDLFKLGERNENL